MSNKYILRNPFIAGKMKNNVKRIGLIRIKFMGTVLNRLSQRKITLLMIKKIRKCFKIYS